MKINNVQNQVNKYHKKPRTKKTNHKAKQGYTFSNIFNINVYCRLSAAAVVRSIRLQTTTPTRGAFTHPRQLSLHFQWRHAHWPVLVLSQAVLCFRSLSFAHFGALAVRSREIRQEPQHTSPSWARTSFL